MEYIESVGLLGESKELVRVRGLWVVAQSRCGYKYYTGGWYVLHCSEVTRNGYRIFLEIP